MEVTTSKINKLIRGLSLVSDPEKEPQIMNKYLPPEVWTLVLVRLPVRTLLRLRCVCKAWCSIIDDPHFVSLHLTLVNNNNNKNNEGCRLLLVAMKKDGEHGENTKLIVHTGEIVAGSWYQESVKWVSDISIGKFSESCLRVLGFSQGVLLMEPWTIHRCSGSRVLLLKLWNPITSKSVEITGPILSDFATFNVGVGFDPSSNDVKVVVIIDPTGLFGPSFRGHIVAIYSLSSGTWRTKDMDVTRGWYYMAKPLVSGGALHWLAGVAPRLTPTHTASFHLDTETFTFTALPTNGETIFPLLVDESFAIIDIPNRSNLPCHVWVMQHEQQTYSWTRWYSSYMPLTAYHKLGRLRFQSKYAEIFIETAAKRLIVIERNVVNSFELKNDGAEYLGTCFVPYSAESLLLLAPHVESLLLHRGLRFTP